MSSESETNGGFTFTWKIENYFSCPAKNGVGIPSPVFIEKNLSGRKWYAELYPDGDNELDKGYISCRLWRTSVSAVDDVDVCCSIELIDVFGKVLQSIPMRRFNLKKYQFINYDKLLERSRLLGNRRYSPEDSLTIRCRMSSNTTTKLPECFAVTKIGADQRSFKLRARNFESSNFWVAQTFFFNHECIFNIKVSARKYDFTINISKRDHGSLRSCFLICKIALLDLNGVKSFSRWASHLYENDNWEFVSFLKKSMLRKEAYKYVRNNSFTLFCEFSVPSGTTLTEIKYIHDKYPISVDSALNVNPVEVIDSVLNENPVNVVDSVSSANSFKMADSVLFADSLKVLLADFRSLYTSHENSDVKLQADNETFPAHKAVLAARSPVFRAMFSQDMLENQTGTVNISDIDSKSLDYLLAFIYTGTMDRLGYEIGLKLLVAADKYQVLSLKEECSSFLLSILSVENVCEVVVVADMVGHELLKSSAVDYIRTHASKILPTVMWKQCVKVKENVELVTEILYKLSVDFEKDN